MNAAEFLDGLYKSIYQSLGQPPPGDDDVRTHPGVLRAVDEIILTYANGWADQDAAGFRDRFDDQLDSILGETLSRYENPFTIKILRTRADELEFAARKNNVPVPPRPLLGTLPHGDVNARTLLAPGTNQHIVLFESEMFMFTHLVAKAVAQVVPAFIDTDGRLNVLAGRRNVRRAIEADPSLSWRFTEVLLFYATTGQPGRATPYIQEPSKYILTDKLRTAMELFVLGHEYGHIQCGHLGQKAMAADLDSAPEELLYNWTEEIEADGVGLGLAIQPALRGAFSVDLVVAGADLYFTVIDLFARAMQLLRAGNEEVPVSATHPPHITRRNAMERALRSHFRKDKQVLAFTIELRKVVRLLWKHARPAVLRCYKEGVRPHARWR